LSGLDDDLENFEKIKVMDRGARLEQEKKALRVDYRMGDIVSPHVDFKEPLGKECAVRLRDLPSGISE